jgi:prepilin-type N-terminal cleavage/methylation domain-containing protein
MRTPGFSLVELLISLSIMSIVSVMVIPHFFQAPSSNISDKYSGMANDVSYMIVTAYERYKAAVNSVASNTTPGALTQYMNYVSVDTSGQIDGMGTEGWKTCSATNPCLNLHNGGKLFIPNSADGSFGGTNTTNVIFFQFDPEPSDAAYTSRSLKIALYYDGYIKTRGTVRSGTRTSIGGYSSSSNADPAWFEGF